MKCVILAAGEGKRMHPHTITTPKPMLDVAGKPLLAHTIEMLPSDVSEIIIVTGYLEEQVKDYFGDKYGERKIKYVTQGEKKGTYGALNPARKHITSENFLVLYADDLFGPEDFRNLLKLNVPAILLHEVTNPERFGVVAVDDNGCVVSITEKPERPKSNLVYCGPIVLTKEIFNHEPKIKPNGELYLTDSVTEFSKHGPVKAVVAKNWQPVGYPEDLEKAEAFIKSLRLQSWLKE